MKRMLMLFAIVGVATLAGCDKPTADECKSAIDNMQKLLGTANTNATADIQGEIRRCRGGSSKSAIQCASGAKTIEELRACKFMSKPTEK